MYSLELGGLRAGASSGESLTSAAVISRFMVMVPKVSIDMIAFAIKTATVSSGNIVILFKKRITVGSDTGAVNLGTLTIPTAIAAGKVYYKNIDPVDFELGEELVVEVTTAAAGGGAAGDGFALFKASYSAEQLANVSDAVLSA